MTDINYHCYKCMNKYTLTSFNPIVAAFLQSRNFAKSFRYKIFIDVLNFYFMNCNSFNSDENKKTYGIHNPYIAYLLLKLINDKRKQLNSLLGMQNYFSYMKKEVSNLKNNKVYVAHSLSVMLICVILSGSYDKLINISQPKTLNSNNLKLENDHDFIENDQIYIGKITAKKSVLFMVKWSIAIRPINAASFLVLFYLFIWFAIIFILTTPISLIYIITLNLKNMDSLNIGSNVKW
ncbi:hypothetical protein AGLY_006320 [Aphis glycines]|uniref:Uncharacterized protein n=1 Tax=Aphis glycines TaxID=307491 RepID=A0A6G0TQQ9_APHGL|nr:hypothetical protein AGLY_006320 [Aphis glycines]